MSRIPELIERIRALGPIPDEEEGGALRIRPPASSDAIEEMRTACEGMLPSDLADLLEITAGLDHTSLAFAPETELVSPDGQSVLLRASHEANGDGLALEPYGDQTRVWWSGHDSWFLVYWAPSIDAFLDLWIERAEKDRGGKGEQHDTWTPLHQSQPCTSPRPDSALSAFIARLPQGTIIHDLRGAEPGTEIPFDCLKRISKGGSMEREGLLFGFTPAPSRWGGRGTTE